MGRYDSDGLRVVWLVVVGPDFSGIIWTNYNNLLIATGTVPFFFSLSHASKHEDTRF